MTFACDTITRVPKQANRVHCTSTTKNQDRRTAGQEDHSKAQFLGPDDDLLSVLERIPSMSSRELAPAIERSGNVHLDWSLEPVK